LAHHLEAVVVVGKEGINPAIVEATRAALLQHELIKVRVLESSPVGREDAANALAEALDAAIAGTVGRIVMLYRKHPEEPRIVLPE
jgi:RNA-binding protein